MKAHRFHDRSPSVEPLGRDDTGRIERRLKVGVETIGQGEEIRQAELGPGIRVAQAHCFQRRHDGPCIYGASDSIVDAAGDRKESSVEGDGPRR